MKRAIFFAMAICISIQQFAQVPVFDWARQIGGNEREDGLSIATDLAGNVYTTGYFTGTVDLDPGAGVYNLTAVGRPEIFISKVDGSGNFVWAKNMHQGISSIVRGNSIAVDEAGNIYVTGFFSGTIDFDPGPGVFNLVSVDTIQAVIFVSRLDSSGNFKWVKQMTCPQSSWGSGDCIAIDASGNIYTTGHFAGTVDFDPGPGILNLTAGWLDDIFVSKLDSSGNFIWAKQTTGLNNTSENHSITVDVFGNVYITGAFGGTVDFDPGSGIYNLTNSGLPDIFVWKLDSSGSFIWAKRIGGTHWDDSQSISADSSGNVYITGTFNHTVDFDPGPGIFNLTASGTAGNLNPFVFKLDSSGNLVWAKQIEATGGRGNSGITDRYGNVYATGMFGGTADFDPGPGTFNLTAVFGDVFVVKLDSSGNFVWVTQMTGNLNAECNSITVNTAGDVYTTGFFDGTVDFDPGVGAFNLTVVGGGSDCFVSKMSQYPIGVTENNFFNEFILFPNPTTGNFTINFAKYTDVEVEAFNITGQLISSASEKNVNTLNYNIRSAPGFYIVEIKTSDVRVVRVKVIKE